MIKVNETQKKEKTGERHPLRAVVFFAFSLLFLLYYAVMILWGGGRSSMAWIWPCAAVLMFGLGIVVLLFGRIPYESPIVVVAVILALSLILTFVFVEAVIISHMSDQAPDGVECIIVLGAAVKGTRPSSALYNRIVTAAEYLHNNPDTVAVLSGGQGTGEDISEAECMRRELVRMESMNRGLFSRTRAPTPRRIWITVWRLSEINTKALPSLRTIFTFTEHCALRERERIVPSTR